MASVELKDIRKAYGKTEAVRGVDISVADGEFVALVGPSGCGKSTLLRMIAGLEDITSGEITIGDRVVNTLPPKDRDIAMVFQDYALYPHLRVRGNLAFSLKQRRVEKKRIEEQVARTAAILGLEELLERFPRQLSGGQRQRVAMGRAIVRDPKVFLFDEPLSNLDAALRTRMRAEIKDLHQRLATTAIYVTHDQIEAMTMADRIVVLRAGVVEQIGSPLELFDRPVNRFVGGFIGSPAMNMLPGRLEGANGGAQVAVAGGRLAVEVPAAAHGRAVTCGVRPEHFNVGGNDGLKVEVVLVEPTGSETLVLCRHGDDEIQVRINERRSFRRGEALALSAPPEVVHLFDSDTGDRIGGG